MNEKNQEGTSQSELHLRWGILLLASPRRAHRKVQNELRLQKAKAWIDPQSSRRSTTSTSRDSFFVGDALIDVKAGRSAGCKTILVGHLTTFLSDMMQKENATPDFMVGSLKDVPDLLLRVL